MCGYLFAKVKRVTSLVRRIESSVAFVVVFAAAVCIVSAGCSGLKGEGHNSAAADVVPLAARVDQLDGEVGLGRYNDTQNTTADRFETDWAKASVNTPVSPGSRVYVKDRSNVGIAFGGRNYTRLNPRTSLDVLSLTPRRTQLALREGSGIFDVGALTSGDLFEVATPNGAINFQEPGLYQVGIDDRGSTLVTVLSGLAQIVGLGGSGQVGRGQLLTFGGPNGSTAYVSQLDPTVCGNITDAYYAYRYPETYDGRYSDYARYQSDPYYTNPYRRSTSYRYIPDDTQVAGLYDLDYYGDWQNVQGYGESWSPRVSSDWAPYRDGYWYDDQPLGLTWISNEPWGWAPYHYGRWVNVNQRWFWVPGEIVSRPVYSPALVAFVPFSEDDRIGWVPLGPGDQYVYRYYDDNYQPHYVGSTTIPNVNVTNYNVPGAVTVVRMSEFVQGVSPGAVLTADSDLLARSRPVLDPYEVPKIKELAPRIRSHGRRVYVPETAQLALNRTVVTSRDPILPAVVGNKAGELKAKSVPKAEGKRKLQITKKEEPVTAIRPDGVPVPADAHGVKKRELRQLEEQRRVQERMDRQKKQQSTATEQQQIRQQQMQQPKKERKAAPQQLPVQRQQQKQMQKEERKAAPQPQQPIPQQQHVQQQQKQQQRVQQQQQKVERKAAQPQGPPANTSPSKGKKPENPKGNKGKP